MNRSDTVRLVAITGGSGAGKSWLADRLQQLLGKRAGRLSQDSFYRDCSHLPPAARHQLNFDHPNALDWEHFSDVLQGLRRNRECRLPVYDFETHSRLAHTLQLDPRPVMIVDGLWLLHHPGLRRQFDLTIYLHCPEDERLRRRIARDMVERQRTEDSVREQFETTVSPMHAQFVSPQASYADLLLHHPCRELEVLQLQERLSRLITLETSVCDRLAALFRPESQPLASPATALP